MASLLEEIVADVDVTVQCLKSIGSDRLRQIVSGLLCVHRRLTIDFLKRVPTVTSSQLSPSFLVRLLSLFVFDNHVIDHACLVDVRLQDLQDIFLDVGSW